METDALSDPGGAEHSDDDGESGESGGDHDEVHVLDEAADAGGLEYFVLGSAVACCDPATGLVLRDGMDEYGDPDVQVVGWRDGMGAVRKIAPGAQQHTPFETDGVGCPSRHLPRAHEQQHACLIIDWSLRSLRTI